MNYVLIYRSTTTSDYLLQHGVAKHIDLVISHKKENKTKEQLIEEAKEWNKFVKKFHKEKFGLDYYFVKEI